MRPGTALPIVAALVLPVIVLVVISLTLPPVGPLVRRLPRSRPADRLRQAVRWLTERMTATESSALRRLGDLLPRRAHALARRALRPSLRLTLAVTALVAVVALTGLTEEVIEPGETAFVDLPALRYFAAHRVAGLTAAMKTITAVGSSLLVTVAATALAVGCALAARSLRPLVVVAVAVGGGALLDGLAKALIARPRPPSDLAAVAASGFAFPSGHAVSVTVLYGLVAYLAETRLRRRVPRRLTVAVALSLVYAVGLSRIYLGVHWVTDVVGGWALGIAWLAAVLAALGDHPPPRSRTRQATPDKDAPHPSQRA